MWRNVLIAMLTLRMLMGSVVCCCTLGAWTTSLSGKAANASCCCTQPTSDSSEDSTPAPPTRHQCPCRSGLNVMAKSDVELFNFESLRVASWLDKLDLSAPLADYAHNSDRNEVAIPADASAGPFAHCRGTEILRLLQTMRC